MAGDSSDTETKPSRPARVAFRSRPAAPPPVAATPAADAAPAPAGLAFTPAAAAHGNDRDILLGYQMFLGRDPENSFVINEAKSSPLRGFLSGLILSGEFETAVLQKLARRAAMPHERTAVGPSPDQLEWLHGLIALPPDTAGLAADPPPDWRRFWTALTGVPGFPRGGEAAVPPGLMAVEASQGFVLVTVEQPRPEDKLQPGTPLNGAGWAIAPEDISAIAVTLDGRVLGQARHGLPRPDVARNFPHYRHVDHCGFTFSVVVPADAVVTPTSQIGVTVTTVGGQTGRGGVRVVPVSMAATQIALPPRLTVEDARIDEGGTLRVRGWALSKAGAPQIAVFLGDTKLGETSCGLNRPAIASAYSDYPDAGSCGFLFEAAVADRPEGGASVRVQLTDAAGETRQVMLPVAAATASADAPDPAAEAGAPGGSRLQCDEATLWPNGRVTISGWALSEGGVQDMAVLRGRKSIATPLHGSSRPDVARYFPSVPEAARSGFKCSFTPSPPLKPGETLTLRLRTGLGETTLLDVLPTSASATGPRATAPAPMSPDVAAPGPKLRVEVPRLDGDAATEKLRNPITILGWAVAPSGIASVAVSCDGTPVGLAHLGERREDLARTFPDYPDALRGGFALVLPPGVVAPGLRHFSLTTTSRDGETKSASFTATVEAPDEALPGTAPRLTMPRTEQTFLRSILAAQGCEPVFSVVVQSGPAAALRATLGSLARQAYTAFELCLAESDAALAAEFGPLASRVTAMPPPGKPAAKSRSAKSLSAKSQRGKSQPGKSQPVETQPGKSQAATTQAAKGQAAAIQAAGSKSATPKSPRPAPAKSPSADLAQPFAMVSGGPPRLHMVLQAGDILGCDALLELAVAYATKPQPDFITADEQRFDPVHGGMAPFFKPAWSPELLLNMDYVGRPWCASQSAMDEAGLSPADLAAQSSYQSVLLLTANAPRVAHVDKVLAATREATSAETAAAALAALAAQLGNGAETLPGSVAGTWRLRRPAKFAGKVSIIIPTAGQGELVKRAIESVRATTAPGMVEIVVLDNVPAGDKATKAWLKTHADKVIAMAGRFNWSRFNNQAVAACDGDMLLFLNDDVEARQDGWLEAMLEHAVRPEVGVTGARLLYPDGKVQHGGIFLAGDAGRHEFRYAAGDDGGPFGLARVSREMTGVTGACQMVRRNVFERLGGFNEAHDVINNDVDFCLRVQQMGLSVIFTPHAELMHHELASRALIEDRYDATRFTGDWRMTMLRGDKFHSRRLRDFTDYPEPDLEPVMAIHAGPRGPEAGAIKRILAVKLDHIGDFLTAIPALRALKRHFPAAHITLLAPKASALLVHDESCVDEVIEFAFFHARSAEGVRAVSEQEYAALEARLKPLGFDMAIDLRMHPETRQVLRHSGAPFLAGYDRDGQFPWLDVRLEWEGDERLRPKPGHITERLLALVEATAVACRPVEPSGLRAPIPPQAVPALAKLPADFLTRRLVCIHPGVGNAMRRWPPEHFGALIDLLGAEEDLHAILIGGAEEQEFAREVQAATTAQDRVISMAGALSLAELSDVIRACVLFVGNDSGPKHMAAALGVPTLGIHSAVVDAEEWAPLGTAAFALERRVVCSPCYLAFASECPRDRACLTGLKPRDALVAARRLLALR